MGHRSIVFAKDIGLHQLVSVRHKQDRKKKTLRHVEIIFTKIT